VLAWNPDADASVRALAVTGNTVYAGGDFHTVAGLTRNNLAAIGIDGALLDWHPDANGLAVSALKVAGGTIYAGFRSDDDIKGSHLVAISTDGQVSTWNPAPNDGVLALAIADNTVFAGGEFTGIASANRRSLAAIDGHGRLTAWNPDANIEVAALAVAGNTVYAGGNFTQVAGQTRNRLAAIGTDGALLDWSPGTDGRVLALAISDNTVYAGGSFTHVTTATQGAQPRGHLAAIDSVGALLGWNPSVNDKVNTLLVSGGTVYVGGVFTQIITAGGTKTRNSLAAIGTDGILSAWDPNVIGPVNALAIIDDTLYAGGSFQTVGGQLHENLAAIGTNGMVSTWQADTNGAVRVLAVSGNTIYISGLFTSVTTSNGAAQRHGFAAIDVSGAMLNWSPHANDDPVNVLAVSGTAVYAGGSFTTLRGLPRFFFGAIDAGGIGEVIP
jgi:hypothetical protein